LSVKEEMVKLQIRLPATSIAVKMISVDGQITGDSPSAVGKRWLIEHSKNQIAINEYQRNLAALSALRKVELSEHDSKNQIADEVARGLLADFIGGQGLTADELGSLADWIGCGVDDLTARLIFK